MRSCRRKGSIAAASARRQHPRNTNGRCCAWTCPPANCSGNGSCIRAPPPGPRHVKNSYASETPVTDGERVYAYFGNVGVFCLDMEGRPVWSKSLPPHATRLGWGTAASPVLHRDRLYLVNDNDEQSYLLALDKRTGKEVWRVDRDEKSNWSTPYVWENEQRTEIVTPGTGKVRAYDLDGKLLWWFKGMSGITIATPYADQGLLYVSSGFVADKQRPLYAIRPGASGDISLAPEQTSNAAIAWSNPTAAPYNPTTLVYRGAALCPLRPGTAGRFRLANGQAAVRAAAAAGGQTLHGVALGVQRPGVLPERGRRDVRGPRGRQVRVAGHEQAGRRRHVPGHARHGRRSVADPHVGPDLLHTERCFKPVNGASVFKGSIEETQQRRPVEFRVGAIQIHMLRPVEYHQLGVRLDATVHGRHFVKVGVAVRRAGDKHHRHILGNVLDVVVGRNLIGIDRQEDGGPQPQAAVGDPVQDRRQVVLQPVPRRAPEVLVGLFQEVARNSSLQVLGGEDRRRSPQRTSHDVDGPPGTLLLEKLHGRHDIMPGTPAEVVDLARRVSVRRRLIASTVKRASARHCITGNIWRRELRYAVEQQNAALLRIAAHEPRAKLLAVAVCKRWGSTSAHATCGRRFGERRALVAA